MYKAGLVALALLAPATSLAQSAPQGPSAQNQTQFLAQPSGRYVIVFGTFARADTYLLDTQTGRVWQSVNFEGRSVWQEMTFVDARGTPQNHPARSIP